MNKIVNAVKEGREVETRDLFNVVNDFCLTRLRVSTPDEEISMSMQVNRCENRTDEYKFSQSCAGFDDVTYHLKKESIRNVESEYNTNADMLRITCKLKDGSTVVLMLINIAESENYTKDYSEMSVGELKDFLDEVHDKKNDYYCAVTEIRDVFGFNLRMRNSFSTYINTRNEEEWKLHVADDFTVFEVPVTDDSINEIYIKDDKKTGSKSIIVKPYNQPFMEIEMLFFKRN